MRRSRASTCRMPKRADTSAPSCCIATVWRCGDAGDQSVLDSEDLAGADALVTATGMDELNMITSLYGHVRGVPQIITKVSHVEGSRVLEGLPIGSVVCPKERPYWILHTRYILK